jgi:hypothetical protein
MNTQTVDGNDINLSAVGGEVIRLVVVSVEGDVYFVCKREEFERAKREGREPACIGFHRRDVVNT